MPLPKDVMNFRWDVARVVKNEGHTANLKSLLLDAQKAADGLVSYANLDAFSKTKSRLDITNIKHEEIDFKDFEKIVADENTVH